MLSNVIAASAASLTFRPADGLSFPFCSALIKCEATWSPIRVEQRIGRVDLLGQRFERISIVNLMYEGAAETDVYRGLRARINLVKAVVGRLQPILSSMPQRIAHMALAGSDGRDQARTNLVAHLQHEDGGPPLESFDIDIYDASKLAVVVDDRPPPAYDFEGLGRLLDHAKLLPPGCEAQRTTGKDVFWDQLGAQHVALPQPLSSSTSSRSLCSSGRRGVRRFRSADGLWA